MEKKENRFSLEVLQDFKFAHRGCDVVAYTKGQIIEVEGECADVAVKEKWAKPVKGKKPQTDDKADQIAALEAKLAAAADADKPAIQAEIDALKAE